MTIVIIAVAVVACLIAYALYVRLIRLRNRALEALSSIDVQLRKRHDLVPNALKLANKFMSHERNLLNKLTRLRTQAAQSYDPSDADAVASHLNAEGSLQAGMRQLFAVAENHPELRSSDTIVQAQQTFNEVEGPYCGRAAFLQLGGHRAQQRGADISEFPDRQHDQHQGYAVLRNRRRGHAPAG